MGFSCSMTTVCSCSSAGWLTSQWCVPAAPAAQLLQCYVGRQLLHPDMTPKSPNNDPNMISKMTPNMIHKGPGDRVPGSFALMCQAIQASLMVSRWCFRTLTVWRVLL